MKQLFENRIYTSLFNITVADVLLAQIQLWMGEAGYWLTKTQTIGLQITCLAVVGLVMAGIRRVLYPDLKILSLKMFSKTTLAETAACVFNRVHWPARNCAVARLPRRASN